MIGSMPNPYPFIWVRQDSRPALEWPLTYGFQYSVTA